MGELDSWIVKSGQTRFILTARKSSRMVS